MATKKKQEAPVFSAEALAEVTGMPAPSVRALASRSILQPSVQVAGRRGRANVYDFDDVVAVAVLVACPGSPDATKKAIITFFQKYTTQVALMPDVFAAIDSDGKVDLHGEGTSLTDVAKKTGICRIIHMPKFLAELRKRAAECTISKPGITGRRPRPKGKKA